MLRQTIAVLAIALAFGSPDLPTSAFARGGGDVRNVAGSPSFRSDPSAGGFGDHRPGNGPANYGGRFRGYGDRDVWGHWGAYYGPMIHAP